MCLGCLDEAACVGGGMGIREKEGVRLLEVGGGGL